MEVYQLAVLLIAVYHASAVDLPSDFKRCPRANANECLKGAIQDALPKMANGLKELHLPPLQPLNIPSVIIGEELGSVNLHQTFKNLNIYNIPLAKVVKSSIHFHDNGYNISLTLSLDNITTDSEYIFKGRILLLPIEGSGTGHIWIANVIAQIDLAVVDIKRKGQTYGEIKDIKFDVVPERVGLHFDGLFGGNEQLANEMNKILNENGVDVWNEVRPGYQETMSAIFKDYMNKIMKKIPVDKLFP